MLKVGIVVQVGRIRVWRVWLIVLMIIVVMIGVVVCGSGCGFVLIKVIVDKGMLFVDLLVFKFIVLVIDGVVGVIVDVLVLVIVVDGVLVVVIMVNDNGRLVVG